MMSSGDSDIEYLTEERASPEERALEMERIRNLLSRIEADAAKLLQSVDLLPDKQAEPIIEKVEELQETIDEQQAILKADEMSA